MGPTVYTLFDTGFGTCGIAWKASGASDGTPLVVGFQLPEASVPLTEARVAGRWQAKKSNAIPGRIKQIIKRVKLHFKGQSQDFRDVELVFEGISQFAQQVYDGCF